MPTLEELRVAIGVKGEAIRELKAKGASKADLKPHIDE